MRKSTRGLITACAGLVAGAAFGATPALAGPGWWPPGHVLGYYNTMSDCGGYASSLSLWDDDYDCNYLPQRVGTPYVLVIQRPVQITQPDVDYEPAPVAEEPTGGALADKTHKTHKAHKAHKATKATKAYTAQNQGQIMSDEPCADVLATCDDDVDVLVAPVNVVPLGGPIVPLGGPVLIDGPYGGPWGGHHGGPYGGPWGGHHGGPHGGPWGGHHGGPGHHPWR